MSEYSVRSAELCGASGQRCSLLCQARRTRRLTELVCVLGHAAGGLPAERLLKRLGMPHSDDTVLRSVKRQAANRSAKVRVAGIDDWSQQRQGRSYGTIVVDLECRQVVEVLGDRSAESTAQWLRKHPEVEIVSRDRCGLYAQGARQGAPQAEQIADRFHLLQNLRETLERQLGRCHPHTAIASPMPSPLAQTLCWEARNGVSGCGLESEAQKHLLLNRQSRRAWWLERFERVKTLQGERKTLEEICQETRLNWRTVAKWTKLKELPQRRTMNPKSTTPMRYSGYLARRWVEGIRSARHLLAEIRKLGYTGSLTHLDRLLSQWRRTGPRPTTFAGDDGGGALLADAKIHPIADSFLCMKPSGLMNEQELERLAQLKQTAGPFAKMRQLAMRFRGILQGCNPDKLDAWLDDAHRSGLYGLRRFAWTVRNDLAAVRNAIRYAWSNGQTEGQINRLKTLKRQMYGRAGIELLRARLLPLSEYLQPTN